jgi:hypothetical protein
MTSPPRSRSFRTGRLPPESDTAEWRLTALEDIAKISWRRMTFCFGSGSAGLGEKHPGHINVSELNPDTVLPNYRARCER